MTEQIKINWYRCKVDKAEMSALMRKSDARGFLQAGGQLLLFAVTGTFGGLTPVRQIDGRVLPASLA